MSDLIKDNVYFSVQAWMVTRLKLKGAERDVYAIIYGYSQDEDSDFHGSLDYISQLTGYSRNAICTALKSLTEKGLIAKTEKIINNIKYCRYRTSSLYTVQVACTENDKSVQVACTNNKHTNISKDILDIDNKKDNKDSDFRFGTKKSISDITTELFIDTYHKICVSLPKVRSVTDKRRKAIAKIMKKYSRKEIEECLQLAEDSDFLKGDNDRGWKADIDFILREDKFANILEGKYGGKKKTKNVMTDIEHLYHGLSERAEKKGGKRSESKY